MSLPFSGERYVPELLSAKISYEHWHRYIFAQQFCTNKTVLDIACGEGYGTAFLSTAATAIKGVDISEEAIAHAENTYGKSNIQFITGSATELPFEDASFDTVVSFETIEHLDASGQQRFISEVKRVLKETGVFLVSTPNKQVYSDQPAYSNPYHCKEFYEDEFYDFLKVTFSDVRLYYQQIFCSSMIQQKHKPATKIEYLHLTQNGFVPGRGTDQDSEYMIAVCHSRETIGTEGDFGSFLFDTNNTLYREKYI
jgi:ubiquinone/menaquinone biosynthesis C-methylase UbiE